MRGIRGRNAHRVQSSDKRKSIRKGFVIVIGLSLIVPSLALAQSNTWRGLTPLRSTVLDVQRILGKPVKVTDWRTKEFSTEEGKVSISYSGKRCRDGWNVDENTILSISAPSKELGGKSAEKIGLVQGKQYLMSTDDGGSHTWLDPEKGLGYYFKHGWDGERVEFLLESMEYFPSRSDNDKRCDGFPPFAPEREYFTMDMYPFLDARQSRRAGIFDALSQIDGMMTRVTNRGWKDHGYAVIYFDSLRPNTYYKKALTDLKLEIRKRRKEYANELVVIDGGLLEKAEMRLYILPRSWPPPVPVPTFPSQNFLRQKEPFGALFGK